MSETTPVVAVDIAAASANATTLSAALTQALKINDESTFQALLIQSTDSDQTIIKATVQRLESATAVKLLERLAEQITATPSKSNQLNLWIKWVMVAHGGYLVSLPHLIKTLTLLHSVLNNRVTILPKLIALQGRLEMLQSQLELRDNIAKKFESEDDEEDSDSELDSDEDEENSDDEDEENSDDEDEEEEEDRRQLTLEADADDLEAEEGDYIINGEEDDDLDSEDDDEDDDDEDDDEEEDSTISRFIDVEAEDDNDNDDDEDDDDEDDLENDDN